MNRSHPINARTRQLEVSVLGILKRYEQETGLSVLALDIVKAQDDPTGGSRALTATAVVPVYGLPALAPEEPPVVEPIGRRPHG